MIVSFNSAIIGVNVLPFATILYFSSSYASAFNVIVIPRSSISSVSLDTEPDWAVIFAVGLK